MPTLAENLLCSGCSACSVTCPKGAISMVEDFEGFKRPIINSSLCVECGLCEKACHVISPYPDRRPIEIYAARAKNDTIRFAASSGGIFPLLGANTISDGGIVWGVRWDRNNRIPRAIHDYANTIQGLKEFRGSKYVQSQVNNIYKTVKSQLNEGQNVLFSGTPCQISGLKHFLKKDYPNLTCCEVICHGVPSPKVLNDYIATLLPQNSPDHEYQIKEVTFRNKLHKEGGWRNGVVVVVVVVDKHNGTEKEYVVSDRRADTDPYLRGFLCELINRPSCHNCTVRNLKSGADITLGDFWKIQKYVPQIDDDMGVSLVCINTEKGQRLYNEIKPQLSDSVAVNWDAAVDSTGALVESPKAHRLRSRFFKDFSKNGFQEKSIIKMLRPTTKQIINKYIRIFKAKVRPYIKK